MRNKTISFGLAATAACALTAFASADVIMDQIGDMDGGSQGSNISASQDFETAYDAYDVIAIDNFTIDTAMNLTSASMVLGGWNGFAGSAGVEGYTVSIFSSTDAAGGSIFGDVLAIGFASGSLSADWLGAGELLTFDLGGVELAAGSYWLGITPANAFATNGQTGAFQSLIGDASGYQANPSGAFGFITQPTGANYAYRLDGTGVPAPGALALLGLAGLAGRRRRS